MAQEVCAACVRIGNPRAAGVGRKRMAAARFRYRSSSSRQAVVCEAVCVHVAARGARESIRAVDGNPRVRCVARGGNNRVKPEARRLNTGGAACGVCSGRQARWQTAANV